MDPPKYSFIVFDTNQVKYQKYVLPGGMMVAPNLKVLLLFRSLPVLFETIKTDLLSLTVEAPFLTKYVQSIYQLLYR